MGKIGDKRGKLALLKIRKNVGRAGHSRLWRLWNRGGPLRQGSCCNCQSSNWGTARKERATTVAKGA